MGTLDFHTSWAHRGAREESTLKCNVISLKVPRGAVWTQVAGPGQIPQYHQRAADTNALRIRG